MFLLCHSRDVRTAASPTEDNLDILSGTGRHDPNALKVRDNHMIEFIFISINLGARQCAIPSFDSYMYL